MYFEIKFKKLLQFLVEQSLVYSTEVSAWFCEYSFDKPKDTIYKIRNDVCFTGVNNHATFQHFKTT